MPGEILALSGPAPATRASVAERRWGVVLPSPSHAPRSVALIGRAIDASRDALVRRQDPDGAWRFPLEGSSVLPDSYFIIAQRLFNLVSTQLERRLVERVWSRQLPNGGWPLYPGHEGDPSTTVEAYIALRMHGVPPQDEMLHRAREFLGMHGGLSKLSGLTRVTLAMLGLGPWSDVPFMPIEMVLLPRGSPVGLHRFVTFTRTHMVPTLVLGDFRYRVAGVAPEIAAELGELVARRGSRTAPNGRSEYVRAAADRFGRGADWTRRLLCPTAVRARSLRACTDYLIKHQEPDGTWGNYILSTIFGVLALRALGYSQDAPIIQRGFDGLRSLLWQRGNEVMAQPCNSAVWSTALVSYCLHETGMPAQHPAIARSARWLLRAQSLREGNRSDGAGGSSCTWGFQEGNALCPDVDDTIAAVRAVLPVMESNPTVTPDDTDAARRCLLGEKWALAMQNDDGGWSSFDRNCRSWWLERIPFNDMHRAMTDPSTADMTGRMLEYLGVRGRRVGRPEVDTAVAWLRRDQCKDGSWFGRWGIAYLYGAWTALMGLAAVGIAPEDPAVRRATLWLQSVQNPDGGWGESCSSDTAGRYVRLGRSTPSQSAWALMGLVSSARTLTVAITRGLHYLLDHQAVDGTWTEDYTTGAGFAGKLYLNYRFYKDVWPLQALGLTRRLLIQGQAWPACIISPLTPLFMDSALL